jgi:hypothetical protein
MPHINHRRGETRSFVWQRCVWRDYNHGWLMKETWKWYKKRSSRLLRRYAKSIIQKTPKDRHPDCPTHPRMADNWWYYD